MSLSYNTNMRQYGYYDNCLDFWLNFGYLNLTLSIKTGLGKGRKEMVLTLGFELWIKKKAFYDNIFHL